MKDICAVILAAGKGTRFKSETAKVLHPLLGRPMLDYVLRAATEAGAQRAVAVVGHQADRVREHYGEAGGLEFVLQSEQLGTGHALLCAKETLEGFTGTALVLCGDVPLLTGETLKKLVATHRSSGDKVTVLSMETFDPTGYGRLVRKADGSLAAIVEQSDATDEELAITEVNSGTYAVELPWGFEALDRVGNTNSQGEYYLTDVVALAGEEGGCSSMKLDDEREPMGVNSRAQLADATSLMRERINRGWMEAGVTMDAPETVWIEPTVELAPDVVIGSNVRLEGDTVVSDGARIDQGVVASDSKIGAAAYVKPYCVLNEARVGPDCEVGPFAHLRPGADLLERSKVGNFVELKKTKLGEGSKANHLAYLGDTSVGRNANIGAGAIICNYDGANKYETTIGDDAFIGSNASLVAPVEVGEGATVAAGSTITKPVEPGSLGISRAKQMSIKRWARPKKKG